MLIVSLYLKLFHFYNPENNAIKWKDKQQYHHRGNPNDGCITSGTPKEEGRRDNY